MWFKVSLYIEPTQNHESDLLLICYFEGANNERLNTLKKTRKYIEFSFTFWEKDISILVSGTFKLSRHTRCTSYCKLLNMSTCGISMSVQVTNHLIYQFETHQYLQRRVVHKSMLIKPCCKSRRPKNFT